MSGEVRYRGWGMDVLTHLSSYSDTAIAHIAGLVQIAYIDPLTVRYENDMI